MATASSSPHNDVPSPPSVTDDASISTDLNSPDVLMDSLQTNLIVNYLPPAMTQEDIRALFANVGELDSCKLVRDKTTGQSLGYGFVNYKTNECAQKAIFSFNGLRLQNKAIKVSFARPSSDTIKGANLYVSGLSKDINSKDLTSMLAPFGTIITSRVLCDPHTGQSKGVGFVRFNLRSEAEEAIKSLNSSTPEGATEPIVVKFANQPTIVTKTSPGGASTIHAIPTGPMNPAVYIHGPAQLYGTVRHPTTRLRYSPLGGITPISPAGSCGGGGGGAGGLLSTSIAGGGCGLFVFNLPPDIDDNHLWALFGQFGVVQSIKVVRDGTTGKSKGFAYVNMLRYEDSVMAIAGLDGHSIDATHVIRVSMKKPHQGNAVPHRLVAVGNLSPHHIGHRLNQPIAGLTANMVGLTQNIAGMPQTISGYSPSMSVGYSPHLGGLNPSVELSRDLLSAGCYGNATSGAVDYQGLSASDVYRLAGYGVPGLSEYTAAGGVATPLGVPVGMTGNQISYLGAGYANQTPLCGYTIM